MSGDPTPSREPLREAVADVTVTVEGFQVASPEAWPGQLAEVAAEIASDIGSALSSLGRYSVHGRVAVTLDDETATSEEVPE